MTSIIARTAVRLVLLWTAVYTWRLPAAARDTRREEITCDLWHSLHDPDARPGLAMTLQILFRLLLGIPDDVLWRFAQSTRLTPLTALGLAAAACGIVLVAAAQALWKADALPLPEPPAVPSHMALGRAAPPPPAPPPPGRSTIADVSLVYAQTTYTVSSDGTPPTRLTEVRPVYPPIAVAFDLRGTVIVEASITDEGRVAEARVVEPAAMVLRQSAVQAVQQWKFEPLRGTKAPGRNTLRVTVNFIPPQ